MRRKIKQKCITNYIINDIKTREKKKLFVMFLEVYVACSI